MFIPAAVGLIDSWQDIGNAWFQYIVVTVVSTFVVMGARVFMNSYVTGIPAPICPFFPMGRNSMKYLVSKFLLSSYL